jgi:hypothetical protein
MKGNETKGRESAGNRFSNRRAQSSVSGRPSTPAKDNRPPPWKPDASQEFGDRPFFIVVKFNDFD